MIKKLMFIALLPLALVSCGKLKQREMLVVRDCTGTYLRLDDRDYKVCNTNATDIFVEGTMVRAAVQTNASCNDDGYYCEMYHQYDSRVRVLSISECD